MNTGKNNLKNENDLDELIRSSEGLSDEQLLEDLRKAERMIDDSQIPPSPEDGFQQILDKIEQQKIKSYRETHPIETSDTADVPEEKKHWIFTKKVRGLLTAAILIGVLMGASVTASGKRNFKYVQTKREGERNDIALNNDENKHMSSGLEDAYQQIHDEIGIAVLKMGYIPKDMNYLELTIDKKHATLSFNYYDKKICFVQDLKTDSSSSNIISNRKVIKTVNNEWLGIDNIEIKSLVLDDKQQEFSAEIKIDNAFYCIQGIMKLEEFVQIIEGLNYL